MPNKKASNNGHFAFIQKMREVRKIWFNIPLGYDTADSEQEPAAISCYPLDLYSSCQADGHDVDDDLSNLPLSAFPSQFLQNSPDQDSDGDEAEDVGESSTDVGEDSEEDDGANVANVPWSPYFYSPPWPGHRLLPRESPHSDEHADSDEDLDQAEPEDSGDADPTGTLDKDDNQLDLYVFQFVPDEAALTLEAVTTTGAFKKMFIMRIAMKTRTEPRESLRKTPWACRFQRGIGHLRVLVIVRIAVSKSV